MTYLMEQGWISSDILGLVDDQYILCWNGYLEILKISNIRLPNMEDVLVWNQSKSGKYSPKAGYLQPILDKNELEISWWWNLIWKLKCPLKSKIFCWFLFSGKALTWDVLCKKDGRDLVDVTCASWMLNLTTTLGWTVHSLRQFGWR